MTRHILLLSFLAPLSGCCSDGKPVSPKAANPLDQFEVVRLFEVNGMAVYRFRDAGEWIYFVDGRGKTFLDTGSKVHHRRDTETTE